MYERALEDMDRKIEAGDVDLGLAAPTLGALRGRGSYLVREGRGEKVFELLGELTGKEARFGQHAVCLETAQFDSLRAQFDENVLEHV